MNPEINQKPIRFISRHWSRGSHKTQTDRQHRHRLEKINKVHIHLTVKTCSEAGKGRLGRGSGCRLFSAGGGGRRGPWGQKQDGEGLDTIHKLERGGLFVFTLLPCGSKTVQNYLTPTTGPLEMLQKFRGLGISLLVGARVCACVRM